MIRITCDITGKSYRECEGLLEENEFNIKKAVRAASLAE